MLGDKVWMKVDRSVRRLLSYYENKRVEWHCAVLVTEWAGLKSSGISKSRRCAAQSEYDLIVPRYLESRVFLYFKK